MSVTSVPSANTVAFAVKKCLNPPVDGNEQAKIALPASGLGQIPFVLLQQVPIVLLASLVLDGEELLQICLIALIAFWGGYGVLCFRLRGRRPSAFDLLVVRYGSLVVCIISFFLTKWIWHLRGF